MRNALQKNRTSAPVKKRPSVPLAEAVVLNTADAARYCARSAGTFANWRSLGKGPRYMRDGLPGSRVYYLRADLDSWLKKQLRGGDA